MTALFFRRLLINPDLLDKSRKVLLNDINDIKNINDIIKIDFDMQQ